MKFIAKTYGCKVNLYETSKLEGLLLERNHKSTSDPKEADYIIINTCAVTEEGYRKSKQGVSHFRKLNPEALICVVGCAAEANQEAFIKLGANVVGGTDKKKEAVLKLLEINKDTHLIIPKSPRVRDYEEIGEATYLERARAYLKIQDGCDAFCSYCLVAHLRGAPRSREPASVLKEAQNLVNSGYHEIVLTGIHLGLYGRDLKPSLSLGDLLEYLLDNLPSNIQIRLGSLEVSEVDEKIISLFAKDKRLANHLHIPLQSGSSAILKAMNRPYSAKEYAAKLKQIRAVRPSIAIAADVIVGFPGETEELFLETYNFIKEVGIAYLHVFPYSLRKGTPAASMKNQVNLAIKKNRVHALLELEKENKSLYIESLKGQKTTLLLEQEIAPNCFIGTTSEFVEVRLENRANKRLDLIEYCYEG